jgi:hypothetical protein
VTILYSAPQDGQLKGIGFDLLIAKGLLKATTENESGAYVP